MSSVIEGYVQLKRKHDWVTRYAKVENNTFTYKKQKSDKKDRKSISLSKARVKFSSGTIQGNLYIQIESSSKETIIIQFQNAVDLDKWASVMKNGEEQKSYVDSRMSEI